MDGSCTLLINSCDAYKDILDTFFVLLNKYWPDLPYDIVLSTESLNYKNKLYKIKNIHPKNKKCTWTERITDALKKINSDYVILMLDDFFLYDLVNTAKIKQCLQWLKSDKNIATFTFWPIYSETKNSKFDGFGKRYPDSRFKVAAIMGIWNKKQLLKYTEGYKENIWQWEANATKRSNTLYKKDKFYIMLNNQSEITPYDFSRYGLFSGKWLKETKQLFKDNNIKFDFSKRGFYNEWERSLSASIIASFEMESAIIPYYALTHKGSSYMPYEKKFKPGDFSQTYNVKGARNVVCWEPSILWGFAIKDLEISVVYDDGNIKKVDLNTAFGSFVNKDSIFIFNQECPTIYIPTEQNKIINKILITGNLFLLKDAKILKETFKKTTPPKNEYYKSLEGCINLERIISREKLLHIKMNPEVKFYGKNDKVIESYIDSKIFKKGYFEYEYKVPQHSFYMIWSPSFYAGYKLNKVKVRQVLANSKIKKLNSKDIRGLPNENIFLDRQWIKIPIDKNVKKIVISGKLIYPIKSKELRRVINNGV